MLIQNANPECCTSRSYQEKKKKKSPITLFQFYPVHTGRLLSSVFVLAYKIRTYRRARWLASIMLHTHSSFLDSVFHGFIKLSNWWSRVNEIKCAIIGCAGSSAVLEPRNNERGGLLDKLNSGTYLDYSCSDILPIYSIYFTALRCLIHISS